MDATLPQGWPGTGLPIRLPIEHFSPPGAFQVDETSDTLLTGYPATDIVMFTLNIPQNQVLRITGIGWDADDEGGMAGLRWTGYANNVPVPGLVNQIAGLGTVDNPVAMNAKIPGSSTFTVKGSSSISLYSWTYTVRVVGYLFTAKT